MKTQYNSYQDLIDELDRDLIDFTEQQIAIALYNDNAMKTQRKTCKCVCDNCLCD